MRRGCGHRHYGYGAEDGIFTMVAIILLAVIALPFAGGYLLIAGKNEEDKAIGTALLIVGIIIYIAIACNS